MSPKLLIAVTAFVALVVAGPLAGTAVAENAHAGHDLHCTNCHVMHATRNDGVPVDPANPNGNAHLLLRGTINETCLSCHDGGSLPDVVASGKSTDTTPASTGLNADYTGDPYLNSGGYFLSDWATDGVAAGSKFGHDLKRNAPVTAIQGTWTSEGNGMLCTECHETHGNENYRNLKLQPGGGGTDIDVTVGTLAGDDVRVNPTLNAPPPSDPPVTYKRLRFRTDNVAFNAPNDVSDWCLDCHTNIDSHTTKHPVNRSLDDADADNVDKVNWLAGLSGGGTGFGTTVEATSGGEYGVPRVRFGQGGADFTACSTAATTNEVNCLTCHKAHGSSFDSGLCWPYLRYSSLNYYPIDAGAACQQCHDRGD